MRLHHKTEKLNHALETSQNWKKKKEKLFGTFDVMVWVGKEQVAAQVELVTLFWSPRPFKPGFITPQVWYGEWDLHLDTGDDSLYLVS